LIVGNVPSKTESAADVLSTNVTLHETLFGATMKVESDAPIASAAACDKKEAEFECELKKMPATAALMQGGVMKEAGAVAPTAMYVHMYEIFMLKKYE
jgi:hypothetical protein